MPGFPFKKLLMFMSSTSKELHLSQSPRFIKPKTASGILDDDVIAS